MQQQKEQDKSQRHQEEETVGEETTSKQAWRGRRRIESERVRDRAENTH